MNKKIKRVLVLLFAVVCLAGCGKEETAPESVEESKVYGEDFRVTIKSAQSWYKSKDFKKDCQFTMQLEYIGEEPEIIIHHGNPLASIGIDWNGKSVIGGGSIEMVLIRETLKRGEPYELTFDADDLEFFIKWFKEAKRTAEGKEREELKEISNIIKNGTLRKGTYEAVAYVYFGEGDGESGGDLDYRIELPLPFEIR